MSGNVRAPAEALGSGASTTTKTNQQEKEKPWSKVHSQELVLPGFGLYTNAGGVGEEEVWTQAKEPKERKKAH